MRLYPRRILRSVLMVAMFVFVMLNLHILLTSQPDQLGRANNRLYHGYGHYPDDVHVQFRQETQPIDPHSIEIHSTRKLVIPPVEGFSTSSIKDSIHKNIDVNNVTFIMEEVHRLNKLQHIQNLPKFGLKLDSESTVIVVQVHDRVEYLKILLQSLRKVRNIQNVLLIISHDVYSKELNEVVETVDFCPVMQIFFPDSQQIYFNVFPGTDPRDCPRNMKKDMAIKAKCLNALHPDKYGHYREPKYCQAKHHWIWKLNHVFEKIKVLDGYQGMVLLLEEDYYVTEDVLTILQMLQNIQKRDCKDCQMLVIGNYDKVQNYQLNSGKVEKSYWISSKHNMGMVFTRKLWDQIKKCQKEFCYHDDYNWDWTIQHLSMKCIPGRIQCLRLKATRIFHIGECGIHHKGKSCNPGEKIKKTEDLLLKNKNHMFPNILSVVGQSRFKLRDPKANGGWGDVRDQELCLKVFNTTAS
ncbi:hypothetical protein SNE40_012817 [Patella caerulea]|uniref:Alpha-1,6-mannosyl-glycoprotein 2-beta-N-acetylglucosaminyltransferase n=1 Tax=Patella caerulea TaxID=87958 RepID=A0AAN8JL09_PATCE